MTDPRIDVLLALLARHRHELTDAFESVPDDTRNARPAGGGWSAANLIEHLASTERSIGRMVARYASGAELRDGTNVFDRARFEREIDMPFFLDRSRRIQGSQPSGELSAAEAWRNLEASRRDLLAVLDQARGRQLEGLTRPHPATGDPLNGYQWVAFIALHEGRHAAQLREIVRS